LIAIDETNAGIGSGDPFQTLTAMRRGRHGYLVRSHCPAMENKSELRG
jgi:hypothetical protein